MTRGGGTLITSNVRYYPRDQTFADASECPRSADIVEEVGGLTVRDGARRQARVSSFVLRQALGLASGSALPAFEGSERWQRGGTRLEHQTDLSA